MMASLQYFIDYIEPKVFGPEEYNSSEDEFAGLTELLQESETVPYTVAEFFEFHEDDLDYLVEPFMPEN